MWERFGEAADRPTFVECLPGPISQMVTRARTMMAGKAGTEPMARVDVRHGWRGELRV